MEQKQNESRASYLIRVVHAFMNETMAGSESYFFDEAECDGLCLADDVDAAITDLMAERDKLLTAIKRTLDDNAHLADGDVCSLKVLKDAYNSVANVPWD